MDPKNKTRVALAILIIVPLTLLVVLGYVVPRYSSTAEAQEAVWATVIIDMGDGRVFQHNVTTNYTTAYGFLLAACSPENANLTVSATYYSGFDTVLVETIDNKTAGVHSGKWIGWQYWVNGEQIMIGADKCQITNGDVLKWSFEEMAF